MQDTFLKIFIHADSGEKIKEPRPYLATIAKNLIPEPDPKKKIERGLSAAFSGAGRSAGLLAPEQIVTVLEILHKVADILARLPERQRLAMIMHYIEEMPQTAIAEAALRFHAKPYSWIWQKRRCSATAILNSCIHNMPEKHSSSDQAPDDRLMEEYALWLVKMSGDECTEEDAMAYQAWQKEDPERGDLH